MPDHEIAIRGGHLVDGTGTRPTRMDVAIDDGRIAAIGPSLRGRTEIDARDRLVTPGFVDIHTHYDPQVLWDAELTPSSWHGVTSVVAGNCGYSLAPVRAETRGTLLRTLDKVEDMRLATLEAGVDWTFESYGDYLDAVESRGVAIHFGGFVGHTPVRLYVMGEAAYEREATADEIDRMRGLVADALRAGALGFSSDRAGYHTGDGGRPVPSVAASQAETEALMQVTAEVGRGIVHVAPGERWDWIFPFQARLGRTLQWSSILAFGGEPGGPRDFRPKLEAQEAAHRVAQDVWAQVTCRPILQEITLRDPTPFYQLDTWKALSVIPEAERAARYADPEWRASAWAEFEASILDPGWETLSVSESSAHPEWVGRGMADLARERGGTPLDALCDAALADDLAARFSVTFANDDAEHVSRLLCGQGTIMGLSDAGAHVNQICDAVMPTDFLAHWVRDRGVMSVERGIHKLTGELARILGLDRGTLEVGSPADVLVLDWARLDPGPIRRVSDLPADGERLIADRPAGVDWVLVNGQPIRADGRPCVDRLDALPGTVLRSRGAT